MICDDDLGVCKSTNFSSTKATLFYIGDPMCSWCYGMSDILKDIETYSSKNGIEFKIVLGGLRSSGQALWDDRFKSFLKNEWIKISNKTGKEFSFSILDLENYDYDTTPACKAVYITKSLSSSSKISLELFNNIQKKFYALSLDPKEILFYKDICENLDIDFDLFKKLFNDSSMDEKIKNEFIFARSLSSSFPSLVLVHNGKKTAISIGYSSFEDVKNRLDFVIKG